jgi:hypothetical protein
MLLVDAVQVREAILSKAVVVAMWILLSCCILLSARTRCFVNAWLLHRRYRAIVLCVRHTFCTMPARAIDIDDECAEDRFGREVEESKRCCVQILSEKHRLKRRRTAPFLYCSAGLRSPSVRKEILRTSQGFALARIGGKRMRWNEMEGGLRWLKQLHQPESPAKAFIECGRSFRGDSDASGTKRCIDLGLQTISEDSKVSLTTS